MMWHGFEEQRRIVQIVRIAKHVVASNGVCQVRGVNGRQGQGGHQSFDTVDWHILALSDTSLSETDGAARTRARARVSSVTVVVFGAQTSPHCP